MMINSCHLGPHRQNHLRGHQKKDCGTRSNRMASPTQTPRPIRETILPPLVLNTNKRIPILRAATRHPDREPVSPVAHSKQQQQRDPAAAAAAAVEGSVYAGARLLTDPNCLHAGRHVHPGPGVTATRLTDPAVPDLAALPPVDCVLLAHYHDDHFDRDVQRRLSRDLPAVGDADGGPFRRVLGVDAFEAVLMPVPAVKVTAMPGRHVPPGTLARVNELLGAVPPTNGWLVELGQGEEGFETGYRIYISGDTLMIDLMLDHLGGTTIPGPEMPLIRVTTDGKHRVQLMRLVDPYVTIPVHFDDYDVFCSPLDDVKKEIEAAGLAGQVVYLDRGDDFRFTL
ncbi:uncharacterized protein P884DRAFT_288256 [Thermothelomyces heterothallicus CBS 202.75]|uniref:uncharacterized protein n=1 Tax=Thermothelomyces heterothallicus CBS 202.75 TaxID=1149848 RepID=UPI0037433AD5